MNPASGQSTLKCFLDNESETARLGGQIAAVLRPGLTIHLRGNLGAGKTTLVRAILRALGYPGKVKSPTYTLVELYTVSNLYLYHFDFYRFKDGQEWEEAGFREYFTPDTVCLVEWPDNAGSRLPPADLLITLEFEQQGRSATIAAETEAGRQCLDQLHNSPFT